MGLLGERGEGAAGAEDGRVADAEDCDEDYGVHDAGEDCFAEAFDGNDKGACGGVDRGFGAEEARLVVRN